MSKINIYLGLCTQVYEPSKPTASEDEHEFYEEYVAKYQGKLLKPMRGSERFLIPMLKEGYEVEGFDASKHMLAALKAKQTKKIHIQMYSSAKPKTKI